jgi:DNA-binding NarL/FixJ family response regulator
LKEPKQTIMTVENNLRTAFLKTVAICDTEPISIEGLRAMLNSTGDFCIVGAETSLINALEMIKTRAPNVAVIDKAFGIHAVMDCARRMRENGTATLVWGMSMSEAEAMRLIEAGAAGVVRKTADVQTLLAAFRSVGAGETWLEEGLTREAGHGIRTPQSHLTGRELQVLELVEKGFRNKDIAHTLGIQAGTVKIHMKHIFEKTGIRGRYGLAVSGLKEKGLLLLPTM